MTESEQKAVDQIERDRHEKEEEMLLLMLLLFGEAIRYAGYAIRTGNSPTHAAQNVILGNQQLGLPGLAPAAGLILASAHAKGAARANALIAGMPAQPASPPSAQVVATYQGIATTMAQGMLNTLIGHIDDAMAAALIPVPPTAKQQASAMAETVKGEGYGPPNPFLLRTVTEKMIVDAYGAGFFLTAKASDKVWGFGFDAILDSVTTIICRTCAGTQLPKDDPWFLTHSPSMHFGCRSLLSIILFGSKRAVATANPPTIQAAPGFGRAPQAFFP